MKTSAVRVVTNTSLFRQPALFLSPPISLPAPFSTQIVYANLFADHNDREAGLKIAFPGGKS